MNFPTTQDITSNLYDFLFNIQLGKLWKIHYVLQKWAFALQVQLAINEYEKENPCLLVVDWSKEHRFSIFSP